MVESMAEGLQTQIRANAKDIGALVGSVERFVTSSTAALVGMKNNFGGAALGGGPIVSGGANPLAGQTTVRTVEGIRQATANSVMGGFAAGRAATVGGSPTVGMPTAPTPTLAGAGDTSGRPPSGGRGGTRRTTEAGEGTPDGPDSSEGGRGPVRGGGGRGGGGGSYGAGRGGPPTGGTSLMTGLAKVVPGLGLVNSAVSEWHSQSAKNGYYRNIEGGTVQNAVGERLREEKYAWNTMGVFSSDEAKQAFQGVTRMGYTNRSDSRNAGTSRHEALDYISQAKQSRDQSVEQGLSQVSSASKSLNVNLTELQVGMEAVAEAAGKAGVNTEMMTRQMQGLLDIGIQRGQGPGAVGFARAIAETNASYGKAYNENVDSSGSYSTNRQARAASMSNMTPGQLFVMSRRDTAGTVAVYDKMNSGDMTSAGITPAMKAKIEEAISFLPGEGVDRLRNDPAKAADIAGDFLEEYCLTPGRTPETLVNVLETLTGEKFNGNPEMAAMWVVEQVAGNTRSVNAAKAQAKFGDIDKSGKTSDPTQASTGSASDLKKSFASKSGGPHTGGGSQISDAATGYMNDIASGATQRIGALDELFAHDDLKGEKGDTTHVLVNTKWGSKVVPLKEAREKYSHQLAAGQVTFVDGAARGKTVQDLIGGADTREETKDAAQQEEGTAASAKALSGDEYKKTYGSWEEPGPGEQGQKTTVKIELSDQAKEWFKEPPPAETPDQNAANSSGKPLDPQTNGSRSGKRFTGQRGAGPGSG